MSQITSIPTAPWDRHLDPKSLASIHAKLRQAQAVNQQQLHLFRNCLSILIQLGIQETHARRLIGKWRKTYRNADDLICQAIECAGRKSVPDPAAYVTATLEGLSKAARKGSRLTNHSYRLLGWEQPRMTSQGPRYIHGIRGQVWLDEFGKHRILPAPAGTPIPSLDEDPGYTISSRD